jgi:hypothetical protein
MHENQAGKRYATDTTVHVNVAEATLAKQADL